MSLVVVLSCQRELTENKRKGLEMTTGTLEDVCQQIDLDKSLKSFGIDSKDQSASQIQTAIDDYLAEQVRRRYRREESQRDEARKEAKRKITAERMAIRRLLEKGGIRIAYADEYRSSASSLDFTPSEGGFFQIHLNAGGSWSLRRPSPEWQAKIDDKRRQMIATLRKIDGLEVKIDTQVKKSNWRGEEEEYISTTYLVRKAEKVSA